MSKAPIRRVSTAMIAVTAVLAILQVAAYLHLWIDRDSLVGVVERDLLPAGVPYEFTPSVVGAGLVVAALPVIVSLWGLANALALFRLYRGGVVFSADAARRLGRLGVALALFPLAEAVATGTASLLLTVGNDPGARLFAVRLSSGHLVAGIAGGILVVVGWVMREAARLADDHSQIV